MKKLLVFILMQAAGFEVFAQNLPLDKLGQAFQRTNLVVRWNVATNSLPDTVSIYRVLPKQFSAEAVSNLVALGGFTDRNITRSNADEVVYKSDGRHPTTQLAISHGGIEYLRKFKYGPTNIAEDIPGMERILTSTSNYLALLGIPLSEIEKNTNGAPNYHFAELTTVYDLNDTTVTNIEYRLVRFNRAVDGCTVISGGTCGDGEFHFGEHGNLVGIDLTWKQLERYKSYRVASRETLIRFMQRGKAVQGAIPMNLPDIDWSLVKSVTIQQADVRYYAGERFSPSSWLMPLASLWTTVDTGQGNVEVEIDCPIIDDAATVSGSEK